MTPVGNVNRPCDLEWTLQGTYVNTREVARELFCQYRSNQEIAGALNSGYAISVRWSQSNPSLRYLFCCLKGAPHLFIITSKNETRRAGTLCEGAEKTSRDIVGILTCDSSQNVVSQNTPPLIFLKNRKNRTVRYMIREIQARKPLRHIPEICQTVWHFMYTSQKHGEKCGMISRRYPTDLYSFLKKGPIIPDLQRKIEIILLHALKKIHEEGMVHRDIKPQNIVLDEQGFPRIIDLSYMCSQNKPPQTIAGTLRYKSPEVLFVEQCPASDEHRLCQKVFSSAQDVWALGIVFMYITNQKHPILGVIEDPDIKICKQKIRDRVLWLSPELQEAIKAPGPLLATEETPLPVVYQIFDQSPNPINPLLKAMLNPDWTRRITASDALELLQKIIATEQQQ